MIATIKSETDQLVFDHFEDNPGVAKMKRRLRQDRFTSEKRLGNALRDIQSPSMINVAAPSEGDKKSSICDAFHPLE